MYDELVKALRNNADHYGFVGENAQLAFDAANAIETLEIIIDGLNTVVKELTDDVRPVTTCDSCIWHVDNGYHYCNMWCAPCPNNAEFFCAYGERPNCGADMRGNK